MMINQSSINLVRKVPVSQVVGHFIKLKKKGVNHQACCPFHNEKSPSFIVSDVKGMYKCFGCGVSGDAISFVMQHDKKTFYEAVEAVAAIAGIQLEYEVKELTPEQQQAAEAKKTAEQQQEQVLNYVVPLYSTMLHSLPATHPARIWLAERKVHDDTIAINQIGWAGDECNTVTTPLINIGLWEAASKLGISRHSHKSDSNYDGYKNRIIFPIKDNNGRLIGLGGRYISTKPADAADVPKYINPADCELYSKSTVLYGLSRAAAAIKQHKCAWVTEGYMDVVSPHRIGMCNTVSTCGTAFTTQQMALLKRHTGTIVMWRDNDDAGTGSFRRDLPLLLQQGFEVKVAVYDGKDPDEWAQQAADGTTPATQDAVMYQCNTLWDQAQESVHTKATAKAEIMRILSHIQKEILRNSYFDELCKKYKWKADARKEFAAIQETVASDTTPVDDDGNEDPIKYPEWVNDEQREAFLTTGYLAINRRHKGKLMVGYFSFGANGKTEITNFIINPLFRIEAGQDSRYLSQMDNGYRQVVVDMPAKMYPNIEAFQGMCVSAGGSFLIFGNRSQWLRIASDLLHNYPVSIEISNLGWQHTGFFAWVDKVYIPGTGMADYDRWGIITHKGKNYLNPASSEAYKQLAGHGTDPYENQRTLSYRIATINFEQWASQMHKVYGQKGIVGIAYAILTLFRDIVFDIDNNCPHLYGFGEPSSGKSKWAESITALFYHRRPAFNLNSGTDFAFFLYMSQFVNAGAHLNEFDIEVIRPEWFQAIKGAYDGEGRVRGKLGSKNATEIQKIVSTLVLTGQKLITADDNSVVTRSIIEPFSAVDRNEEISQEYSRLKDWEATGIGSLVTEVLQHRELWQQQYKNNFNNLLSHWRKNKPADDVNINQRIMQNYAHMATGYTMLSHHITLPQLPGEYTSYCYAEAVKWSRFIRSSDTLSVFWHTLESLANNMKVTDGWDFDVKLVTDVRVSVNRTEDVVKTFTEPTNVFFLRINNVHHLFQLDYRQRTNQQAMSLENLLHYFSSRTYYIGPVRSKRFRRYVTHTDEATRQKGTSTANVIETAKRMEEKVTSCFAFYYDQLGIDITMDITDGVLNFPNNGNDDEPPF